jgi:hypothetical protein
MLGFACLNAWMPDFHHGCQNCEFSVRFNGELLEKFSPTRGLRQGDPLSPYLFLFVAEGLSSLLQHQISTNMIQEMKISRKSPCISHLLFADDSLLFFNGNGEQANKIKLALCEYEKGT